MAWEGTNPGAGPNNDSTIKTSSIRDRSCGVTPNVINWFRRGDS